jgi:hypothetical protein
MSEKNSSQDSFLLKTIYHRAHSLVTGISQKEGIVFFKTTVSSTAAFVGPILTAIGLSLVLGWPVRFSLPGGCLLTLMWLVLTVAGGRKLAKKESFGISPAIAKSALWGFRFGSVTLMIIFLSPTVADECGTVYYHYPFPLINTWVNELAYRMDDGGCL